VHKKRYQGRYMSCPEKNARQNNDANAHTNCYPKHRRFTAPKGRLKKVDMASTLKVNAAHCKPFLQR
jgi:hypothetical protein